MSAELNDELLHIGDSPFIEALIAHCKLSPDNVAQIAEGMRGTRRSFAETACQLNLASQKDINDVNEQMHRRAGDDASDSSGIFERAIHSVQSRALMVRRGAARRSNLLQHVDDAFHPRNEQVRALRTDLMLLNDSVQRSNVFAFVGPGRSEGRSQLCAELAIAFAQLGRRALLVDADLRHPRQHIIFTTENQWGLSQALAEGDSPYLNGVEGLPELTLLTSGPVPSNPLELLSHRRFELLVNNLRNQYDFIIVDTPAVSLYADALQIASVAHRVVAVGRAEATSFKDMKEMMRRLAVTDSTILGAVVNRF